MAKETKDNQDKQKYSVYQNTVYLYKNMLDWNKKLFIFTVLNIITSVIMPLLYVYLPRIVIENVVNKSDATTMILSVGSIALLLMVVKGIQGASAGMMTSGNFLYRIKYVDLITKKAVDCDYSYLEDSEYQQIWERASNTCLGDNSGLLLMSNAIMKFCINVIGLLLYSVFIIQLNPIIVVVLILISLINAYMTKKNSDYDKKMTEMWNKPLKKLDYCNMVASDIANAKDIKIYSQQRFLVNVLENCKKEIKSIARKHINMRYVTNLVNNILSFLRDGGVYIYLIYLVTQKSISISDFVFYFGLVAGFSTWISGVIKHYKDMSYSGISVNYYRGFVELANKFNNDVGIDLPKQDECIEIEFKNVSYKYDGSYEYVLKDFNFKINAGEKLAIVGANGSGKTTLVKLMCGLIAPTSGEIYINGKEINLYNRKEVYSLFSVVFQEIFIYPTTVKRNIALTDDYDKIKFENALRRSGLFERFNNEEELDTMLVKQLNYDGIDLSGGEAQKLVMARALYKDAPIIMLDEPTAALDPIAENKLYLEYNEFSKGKTSIFISHRLATTQFCNKIIFIKNGIISEIGTHKELLAMDNDYAHMFNVQSHYYKENLEEGVIV